MPSILDVNFDEVTDLKAVDDGEYKLRIINAKVGFGKDSGNPYFMVFFEIEEAPNAQDFNWLVMVPVEGMDAKRANNCFRDIKNFAKTFDADLANLWGEIKALAESNTAGEIDWVVGNEGWALLKTKDDAQYGARNEIKRFM